MAIQITHSRSYQQLSAIGPDGILDVDDVLHQPASRQLNRHHIDPQQQFGRVRMLLSGSGPQPATASSLSCA